jgi:hypothetical protein
VWRQRLRVAEAMLLLAVARFLVARVRFSLWRATLGRVVEQGEPSAAEVGELPAAEACALAVRRAAWRLPGSLCLPQAMALQWMLRRRGVAATVLMGVAGAGKRGGRLGDLHAWLELGNIALLNDGGGVHHPLLRLETGPFRSRVDRQAKKE